MYKNYRLCSLFINFYAPIHKVLIHSNVICRRPRKTLSHLVWIKLNSHDFNLIVINMKYDAYIELSKYVYELTVGLLVNIVGVIINWNC